MSNEPKNNEPKDNEHKNNKPHQKKRQDKNKRLTWTRSKILKVAAISLPLMAVGGFLLTREPFTDALEARSVPTHILITAILIAILLILGARR